jgi:hypothetical protein
MLFGGQPRERRFPAWKRFVTHLKLRVIQAPKFAPRGTQESRK